MDKIYATNNDLGTSAKYLRGSTTVGSVFQGTCCAQSILVLNNFNKKLRPLLTKPDPMKALILQANSEVGTNTPVEGAKKMFSIVGLRMVGQPVEYSNMHKAILDIVTHQGLYLIGMLNHVVAIANQPSGLYFFDSNSGLYTPSHEGTQCFINIIVNFLSANYTLSINARANKSIITVILCS